MEFCTLILITFIFSLSDGFLTDGGQQSSSGHHDSTGDLLAILVEEKDLRHELAQTVTQMKSEMDILKNNLTEMDKLKRDLTNVHSSLMTEKQRNQNLTTELLDLKKELQKNGQQTSNGHHDSTATLLSLLAEEKDLRYQLAEVVTEMKSKMDALEHNLTSVQELTQSLLTEKERNQNLTTELLEVRNELQSLKNSTTENQNEVVDLKALLTNISMVSDQQVAFSVYTFSDNFGANQTIAFNDIKVNVGGGYRNGIFHCPVDGLYMFSVTLSTSAVNQVYQVMKNNITLANIYTSLHDSWDVGSVTVMSHVGVGDRVWVLTPVRTTFQFSYFTGALTVS